MLFVLGMFITKFEFRNLLTALWATHYLATFAWHLGKRIGMHGFSIACIFKSYNTKQ